MQTAIAKILTSLGVTKDQANIYQALLALGEATVQALAEYAGVKRSSAYYMLLELQKRGMVYETKHRKRTYYIPAKADDVLRQWEKKVAEFRTGIDLFHAIENQHAKKARMYMFEGAAGFKKIWEMIFDSGVKEYCIMGDPREFLSFVRKGYITGRIIAEKKLRGIRSRQLVAFSEYAKEIIAKDQQENRVSKMLPHIYPLPYATIIVGSFVALIAPSSENMIVMIESDGFARTQQSLFDALWERL